MLLIVLAAGLALGVASDVYGGLGVMGQGMTSIVMAADGGLEIEGAFTSVRGQPRPGRARLRPDGSLDD